MVTNDNSSTFLLLVVSVISVAVFGMGLTALGAATHIPSLYNSISNSRLQTLPHVCSLKVWEGAGLIQVKQENNRTVLRLETEEGCISLFPSLSVNLQRIRSSPGNGRC